MYNALTGGGGIISSADDAAARAASLRKKRLNKPKNNLWLGVLMDLIWGAGPWVLFWIVICCTIIPLNNYVDGAADVFLVFNAPVAISAIATFASFLLVTRQSSALGNNAAIISQYGNLTGSLVNIALFIKSQISSGKSIEFLTLADGSGGMFSTTRLGLVCSSIPYAVKYVGRGQKIQPIGLPIGQDPRLLRSYILLTAPANGSPGMSPFAALLLMVGELVDEFQEGQRASEYAVLFGQINSVTAAEGAIGGTAGYSPPVLMKWLLVVLYGLYLILLAITDLCPNNGWNALWSTLLPTQGFPLARISDGIYWFVSRPQSGRSSSSVPFRSIKWRPATQTRWLSTPRELDKNHSYRLPASMQRSRSQASFRGRNRRRSVARVGRRATSFRLRRTESWVLGRVYCVSGVEQSFP